MIKCNHCDYVGEYTDKGFICPSCGKRIAYSTGQMQEALMQAREAVKKKEYSTALDLYIMLSDMQFTEAEREYAEILERGAFVTRDLDEAMQLFLRAAKKNDARAAYRYSRLAERLNEDVSRFWLFFSAVIGCEQAYPALAKQLSKEGKEELATYYYYLAAVCEDKESIGELAMRYYNGIGAPKSEAYAKWYFDKFFVPPIFAVKIVYKLRSVTAEEPPVPMPEDYDGILHSLARDAREYGIDSAYLHLNEILVRRGDVAAAVAVGAVLVEGVGCEQDVAKGVKYLDNAAAHGSADAYGYLGSIYLRGEFVEKNVDEAIRCLTRAGECGSADAYEILGDLYKNGEEVEKNSAKAIEYYEFSKALGSQSGAKKASELKRRREDFYARGLALEDTTPEEAFRAFAISTAMGYLPAERKLARCYEVGRGTDVDRIAAFYWYESAANKGDTEAFYDLGRCYAEGIGVAFDYKKAIEMFIKSTASAELVKARIVRLLERKKRKLTRAVFSRAMRLLHQKKLEEAVEILKHCEALGHAKGVYTLGCLMEFGFGLAPDRAGAYALYESAYKMGFRDARQSYKLLVLKMVR